MSILGSIREHLRSFRESTRQEPQRVRVPFQDSLQFLNLSPQELEPLFGNQAAAIWADSLEVGLAAYPSSTVMVAGVPVDLNQKVKTITVE